MLLYKSMSMRPVLNPYVIKIEHLYIGPGKILEISQYGKEQNMFSDQFKFL